MTNGNSPKIAREIIDAILAYGDARADKDLVKGTASLKKSIELIRSALSVCADGGKGEAVAWAAVDEDGKVEALGFNRSRRFDIPLSFAAPQAECAPRIETASEHIARDIREGRFPQRSDLQTALTLEADPCAPRADAEKDAGLTDAAIQDIANNYDMGTSDLFWEFTQPGMLEFARAILAANK